MASEEFKDEARRRELATFLRTKRERMTPPRVTRSSRQRRLTPGLRREEVAQLAGVGTTWYTWLEQARDIRPSEHTLRLIARALQLDRIETKYLLDVGLEHARPAATEPHVPREVLAIMNGMNVPAFVLGRTADLLAYNLAANALCDFAYAPDRNYIRGMFTPVVRAFLANWPDYARYLVTKFRMHFARLLADPGVAGLLADLTRESPEFRQWWSEQAISEGGTYEVVCNHPFVGRLELEFSCLAVLEHPGLIIVALVAEGAATEQRLAELIRQLERGERDAGHNLWTALEAQISAHDEHSDYH